MIRLLIVSLLVLLIILYNQEHRENFNNNSKYEIIKRCQLLVCAYYNLLHNSSITLLDDNYNYEYVLEWRKKTRTLGLPYVYDYIFYKITDYIVYSNTNGIAITYKDIQNYIYPYVKEIYIKNEKTGYVKMLDTTETCSNCDNCILKNKIHKINVNEVLNLGIGLTKVSMVDMSIPAIYNRNTSTQPKFIPFSITSDRGGNNTTESFP